MAQAYHPLDDVLKWLYDCDFAVLSHGFEDHGRDYFLVVQDCLGSSPGEHLLTFTHCVRLDYETRITDNIWSESWTDEFTDLQRWLDAGEPNGYVWGVKWAHAYPGICAVRDSTLAKEWSKRLGKEMYEVTLEANQYLIRLIFHSVISRKLSDKTELISSVTHKIKSGDK